MSESDRREKLAQWLMSVQGQLPDGLRWAQSPVLEPVSGDASFRNYYRAWADAGSVVLMDAPPAQESSEVFVELARQLATCGLNVPMIHAEDVEAGFVCLEDFGDVLFLHRLCEAASESEREAEAARLYRSAFGELLKIQQCNGTFLQRLPSYDEALLRSEMTLFTDWLCEKLLKINFAEDEREWLQTLFTALVASAQGQKQVCVHRDYHSRNLMYREGQSPGILDFQDAVAGPVSYDLVSLLKDCYIAWPHQKVLAWALEYRELALQAGILQDEDEACFIRSFELMGVQRHLKAAGIFARLYLRDGKSAYLGDIPRTIGYISALAGEYEDVPGFTSFQDWLQARFYPALAEHLPVSRDKVS